MEGKIEMSKNGKQQKHAGGRPLKFKSVAELKKKVEAYFEFCDPHMEESEKWEIKRTASGEKVKDENGYDELVLIKRRRMTEQVPYTITGLATWLETSRETLLDYEERHEFSDTIKAAKDKCENYVEVSLLGKNPTGAIFNLKNNYGWRDRSEQENTGEQKIIIETRKLDVNDND